MARILVVDDEESIRYTFDSFLSDEGHEVLAARDYDEALKHISATDVDMVFSDVVLGGKTGIDVLSEIRTRGLTCPVVMITGFPDIETEAQAMRLGAFDYVPKPVVQERILHLTEMALRQRKRSHHRKRRTDRPPK